MFSFVFVKKTKFENTAPLEKHPKGIQRLIWISNTVVLLEKSLVFVQQNTTNSQLTLIWDGEEETDCFLALSVENGRRLYDYFLQRSTL